MPTYYSILNGIESFSSKYHENYEYANDFYDNDTYEVVCSLAKSILPMIIIKVEPEIRDIHYVATYFYPNFNHFSNISDENKRQQAIKTAQEYIRENIILHEPITVEVVLKF